MDHPYDAVLQQARRSFAAFYDTATTTDATWFDGLVLAHVTLTEGMKIPRESLPDRLDLERACDEAEQRFMKARDAVRECSTFRRLVPGDQKRIEAVLFELFPPTS